MALMDAQNTRIEALLQKTKQQQYKLDKQSLQIKSLQSKVNLLIPFHLKDNKTQSPKWRINLKKSFSHANQSQNASMESAQTQRLPVDCQQLFLEGERSSGLFQIQPPGAQPFKVHCDMTAEGAWTVIQRRVDGSVDFDQLWEAYKNGFGDLNGDFWLGLEKIYSIVQNRRYNLLIELEDWEGEKQLIQFLFSLGEENTAYTLSLLGPVSGELENAVGDFRQLPFSTRDQDHDLKADTNCAKHLSGGWWFSSCGHANLNGKYFRSIPRQRHERKQGIFWKTWKGRLDQSYFLWSTDAGLMSSLSPCTEARKRTSELHLEPIATALRCLECLGAQNALDAPWGKRPILPLQPKSSDWDILA
ncbi:angiopoietin-related protein 4 isoform B [Alligator mississippiensis]|uniref:Angiopoietin-related protein 4 isoform B n=1 Tax=Alligator mississippiensis TaxID=8496 RepID=A0A151ND10_ALLMI|nr:angiopoietin-related protein 4 isoform B [Alligator mississippiensis]